MVSNTFAMQYLRANIQKKWIILGISPKKTQKILPLW